LRLELLISYGLRWLLLNYLLLMSILIPLGKDAIEVAPSRRVSRYVAIGACQVTLLLPRGLAEIKALYVAARQNIIS
jgi:hypothetical protein